MIDKILPDNFSDRVKKLFYVYENKRNSIFEKNLINDINNIFNVYFKKNNDSLFSEIIFNIFNEYLFKFYSFGNENEYYSNKFNDFIKKYLFLIKKYKLSKEIIKLFTNILNIDLEIYFLDTDSYNNFFRIDDYEYTENNYRSYFIEMLIYINKRYFNNYLWFKEKEIDLKNVVERFRYVGNRYIYTLYFDFFIDINSGFIKVDDNNKIKFEFTQDFENIIDLNLLDNNVLLDNNEIFDVIITDIYSYFENVRMFYIEEDSSVEKSIEFKIYNYMNINGILKVNVLYNNFNNENNNIMDKEENYMDIGILMDDDLYNINYSDKKNIIIKRFEFFLNNIVYGRMFFEYDDYNGLYLEVGNRLNFILNIKYL